MMSTPGPGHPCLPAPLPACARAPCPPAGSCADAQGAAQDVPAAPAATACHWRGTSQSPSSLFGFPQPWTSWDYLFLSEQPLTPATPHQHRNQPRSLSFTPGCCHRREQREERQSQEGFSLLPFRVIPPHGGGCLREKPQQRPSGVAQPCQARSILPLNMKLPLSPNPLQRGWVSPHFSSLMLTRCGGLRGSAFTSLFLPCVLFSPPLLPLLLRWLFQRSGDAGAAPAAIVM